jgi:Tol biopolymer transport system component
MPPGTFGYPRVSRNGKTVAYEVDSGNQSAIWIYPLSSSIAPRQLTIMGSNRYPAWSGDERVAFQSDREGDLGIWWQRADGIGPAERLTKAEKGVSHIPDSWSRDGQTLSYTEIKSDSSSSIWTLSLHDRKPTLFAQLPSSRLSNSVFSPDDRWIAYQTIDNTGVSFQVDVQRYPPGDRYQLPKDGTEHHALFSPNGKELFYVRGAGQLNAVSISTQPSFAFSSPVSVPMGSFRTLPPNEVRDYDILPDGRLLGVVLPGQTPSGPATQQIQVVLNWFEELKQRVPVR